MEATTLVDSATCIASVLGSLLPEYIVGLLDDAQGEQMERHLAECVRCKERYLTMLHVRREAMRRRDDDSVGS